MGLSLKKITKGIGKLFSAAAPILAPTVLPGPFGQIAGALLAPRAASSVFDDQWPGPVIPDVGPIPGPLPPMMPAGFGLSGMSATVANAISKLAARFGMSLGAGSLAALRATGTRIWTALMTFARTRPGLVVGGATLLSLLGSLGLTNEEAASFVAWGATRRRARRGRGITGRDLKTTRRTIRKVISMSSMLRELCGAPGLRARASSRRRLPPHQHLITSR